MRLARSAPARARAGARTRNEPDPAAKVRCWRAARVARWPAGLKFACAAIASTLAASLMLLAPLPACAAADPVKTEAPRMEFVPPQPGTYALQRIQASPQATLLDPSSKPTKLSDVTHGKITLLTFFYTYCSDPWGCPFAYKTLTELRDKLLAESVLASRVRFVNISFDPTHDTPEAIKLYGGKFLADPRFEWRFFTARNVRELLPLLEDFGQDVAVELNEKGQPTRTKNHMLKLFLIDARGMVREIYSLDFIQQGVMLNDIKTLAMEK
jgi:cytochrome oxidase Cu insertion factor (SCO1/SenC/PrrC family)